MRRESKGPGSRSERLRKMRVRRAARTSVPGFPEFVERNSRCRLCGLVETNPELLRRIHLTRRQGGAIKGLADATASLFREMGEPPLDRASFRRHFEGHVMVDDDDIDDINTGDDLLQDEEEAKVSVDLGGGVGVVLPLPLANTIERAQAEAAAASEDDDAADSAMYTDLADIIARIRNRIDDLEAGGDFVIVEADNKETPDERKYKLWMGLVTEYVRATEALTRAKNSNRVLRTLLTAHGGRVLKRSSDLLTPHIEALIRTLEAGEQGDPIEFRGRVVAQTRALLTRAAKEAAAESVQHFKLH